MDERARNAVVGALVADAASLGLHWIYDPVRVAEVAGKTPEFREPDIKNYRGTAAYFAHAGKRAGDSTHYGEQLLVLLRSLAARDGAFDAADYERSFVESFGPGGRWVGYIDFATRETLFNIDRAEHDALAAARAFDLGSHEKDRALMESKVMANARRWSGERLAAAMENAVRITHGDDAALIAAGIEMARAVEAARSGFHGADDVQLPAVSKLPALVARIAGAGDFDEQVERAVRVTNNNDAAVAWSIPVARALEAAVGGAPEPLAVAVEHASGAVRRRLEEAMAFRGGVVDAAAHFGAACNLEESIPVCVVAVRDATEFLGATRDNISAGGDNAGRAVVVGAFLGAAFGAPADWRDRTGAAAEAARLLHS